MKLKYFIPLIIILICYIYFSSSNTLSINSINNAEKHKKEKVLIELIKYILEKKHYNYSKDSINDALSKKIFYSFLDNIDSRKLFFTQKDIDRLKLYENLIDNQIINSRIDFFEKSIKILSKKIKENKKIYTDILSKPFNFKLKNDSIKAKYLDSYAKDDIQLREKWRKYLKYRTLNILYEKIEDSTYNDLDSLEKESRKTVLDIHNNLFNVYDQTKNNDWFSIYINSFIENLDPHTYYFPPKEKKKFSESMSGHIEGIGARLYQKQGYITVAEVIYGGPAWKQGDLEVGDKIIKAIQGKDKKGKSVDLIGMPTDDAIEFIKGKKGTQVTLYVKKVNKSKKYITITRDIIELEGTFAKSTIIKKDNNLYGYILLPKFYSSFNKNKIRSSSGDIRKKLLNLKRENVKGLILDLRYNGGGYLMDAIKIAGFFIGKGPVVQVRSKENRIETLYNPDTSILYRGNMVIIVNQFSASASEILASAMLDYNRAIIIGTNRTFGKGTVQSMINLDKHNIIPSPIGSLKITTQKFYRVNGDGTQIKGLSPQIIIPNRYSHIEYGEKEKKNAIKWDKIKAVKVKKWNNNKDKINTAKDNSIKRISKNYYVKTLHKKMKWIDEENKDSNISLNLKEYKKEQSDIDKELKKFDLLDKYNNKLNFLLTKYDSINLQYDTVLINKKANWTKSLSKDIYISESVNILEDLSI